MRLQKVDPADLPDAPSPTTRKKELDEAVGGTEFGCNLYEADPGQQISMGYHYHPDHEELMYVIDGRLRFETPDGEIDVAEGEALFVPVGAEQKGYAAGERTARFLAIGAPKSEDRAVIQEFCESCGETTARDFGEESDDRFVVLYCAECGVETDRYGSGPD